MEHACKYMELERICMPKSGHAKNRYWNIIKNTYGNIETYREYAWKYKEA